MTLKNPDHSTFFALVTPLQEKHFSETFLIFKPNLLTDNDIMSQTRCNIYVNFKNLIGFAIDFWESEAPAPYFKAGKMQIIKRKAPGWMSLFPWTLELGF